MQGQLKYPEGYASDPARMTFRHNGYAMGRHLQSFIGKVDCFATDVCHCEQFTRSCAPGYKWKKLNYFGTVSSSPFCKGGLRGIFQSGQFRKISPSPSLEKRGIAH